MKKLRVCLLVLAAAMAAGPAFAQDTGKWSYSGLFEGRSLISLGTGSFGDYWDNATVKSFAGAALLRMGYARRTWDVSFVFGASETSASPLVFRFNWIEDWAGFKAESQIGLDDLRSFSLETLKASLLHAWLLPFERQLEIRFTYNDSASEVLTASWPHRAGELTERLGNAGVGSNGPLRFVAAPNAFPYPLKFGAVLPLPLATQDPGEISLADKFLGEAHLFAGLDLSSRTLFRAGVWLAPEEHTNPARTFTSAKIGGLPFGLNLNEVLQLDELNHWDDKGKLTNTLALGGIPVPATSVKLTAVHILNYNLISESMKNEFQLMSDFSIGPVNVKPWGAYSITDTTKRDNIESGLEATYSLNPVIPSLSGSGLDTKLTFREEGIHTHVGKTPVTKITIGPEVGFWAILVPKLLIFQIKPSVPLTFNLANSEEDTMVLSCRSLLALNVKPNGNIAFDSGYDGGQDNSIWLAYSTTYNLKENEFASGSITLQFKIVW